MAEEGTAEAAEAFGDGILLGAALKKMLSALIPEEAKEKEQP